MFAQSGRSTLRFQHISAAGDGHRAVFLLHGLGRGKALWEPQLDALKQAGWRAIAWDMPGYGDSALVGVLPATYRAAVHAMVGFDRRSLLSAIAVPTLALVGEADPVAPPAVVQTMADKIPGARYELLPRSGHLTSLEQPERFNQAVLRFLSEQG